MLIKLATFEVQHNSLYKYLTQIFLSVVGLRNMKDVKVRVNFRIIKILSAKQLSFESKYFLWQSIAEFGSKGPSVFCVNSSTEYL